MPVKTIMTRAQQGVGEQLRQAANATRRGALGPMEDVVGLDKRLENPSRDQAYQDERAQAEQL